MLHCEYRQTFVLAMCGIVPFNIMHFLVCKLKNSKTKQIFVSKKKCFPGPRRVGPVNRVMVHVWHCEVG